jgi:hypothetical protein
VEVRVMGITRRSAILGAVAAGLPVPEARAEDPPREWPPDLSGTIELSDEVRVLTARWHELDRLTHEANVELKALPESIAYEKAFDAWYAVRYNATPRADGSGRWDHGKYPTDEERVAMKPMLDRIDERIADVRRPYAEHPVYKRHAQLCHEQQQVRVALVHIWWDALGIQKLPSWCEE